MSNREARGDLTRTEVSAEAGRVRVSVDTISYSLAVKERREEPGNWRERASGKECGRGATQRGRERERLKENR